MKREREMDETSEGWSEGRMDEGRKAGDGAKEICNEILASQTGCCTLILNGYQTCNRDCIRMH